MATYGYIWLHMATYGTYGYVWLHQLCMFCIDYERLPSDKNKEIKSLGLWVGQQIMKTPEIKLMWEEFIKKYPHLFTTPEEDWKEKLNLNQLRQAPPMNS